MTEVAEAEALILAHMPKFAARHEPLGRLRRPRSGRGRPCRARPTAVRPRHDGRHRDRVPRLGPPGARSFEVVGTQAAGAEPLAVARAGAVRRGHDRHAAAARRRHRRARRARRGATARPRSSAPTPPSKPSNSCTARGSDRAAGSVVLRAGMRLGAPEMAVLAGAGARARSSSTCRASPSSRPATSSSTPASPSRRTRSARRNDRAIEASLIATSSGRTSRARGCATTRTHSPSRSIGSTPSSTCWC